jgi:hypothetical protein
MQRLDQLKEMATRIEALSEPLFMRNSRTDSSQNASIGNETERTRPDPADGLEESDEIDLAPESGGTSMVRGPGSLAEEALRSRENAKSGGENMSTILSGKELSARSHAR